MPEERIQKVLAAAGVASRRASETLVAAGRVRVDGKPATLGQKVDPDRSRIEVDGAPVGLNATRAYVALHKPAGVTSTTRDRHAEMTVLDLVPTALTPDGIRLYPVGRLDLDSEGRCCSQRRRLGRPHPAPRFGVEREYAVALRTPLAASRHGPQRGHPADSCLAKLAAPVRTGTPDLIAGSAPTLDPRPDHNLVWYGPCSRRLEAPLRRMFGAVERRSCPSSGSASARSASGRFRLAGPGRSRRRGRGLAGSTPMRRPSTRRGPIAACSGVGASASAAVCGRRRASATTAEPRRKVG